MTAGLMLVIAAAVAAWVLVPLRASVRRAAGDQRTNSSVGGLTMGGVRILRFATLQAVDRGNGVASTPLVGEQIGASGLTTGVTRFPPGGAIPLHFHNCPEQVTILEGAAEVEVAGERSRIGRYDTTYIPAGVAHRFTNTGAEPLMILWIYGSSSVTRTFVETGETVEHLSSRDRAAKT